MKPALQLRASQHLALTPQLQQSIRLLQMSTLELETEIEQALQDNPMLEREDAEPGEPPRETVKLQRGERRGDGELDDEAMQQEAPPLSLAEHLMQQLKFTQASPRDAALVELLIGELDDNGYLSVGLDEVEAMLPAELEVDDCELRMALNLLQSFDPAGVGARDMAECLAIQLRQPDLDVFPELADARVLACTRRLCQQHLALLAARDYIQLKRTLQCDEATLRTVQSVIRRLNPRPGSRFGAREAQYVIPDIIVRQVRGRWVAELNPETMPRLSVNQLYASIVKSERGSGLADQLREARWLIRNIQQRCDTITRVAQEIVDRQQGFFEHGAIAMRPLVLREIAEALELHESTISRVTTQKYMLTPLGTFEFKYFFGSQVSTQAGGVASATAVQTLIRQMIAAENAHKPLSDNKLAQMLAEQGMVVARRTVAKYREALRIPPASQRKTL
ncbi:RNA polymerase factor sigma-54 [Verticiella sediminum]|uniref:RNA polymerase sigma-54 factor n=1 Tax=Verticiella sediminum TaxID=1247510 RepID=A0A556AQ47_9BURK|nr:RNA polymerase factor sigma-54 [Verticiella sediminum]TSH95027.1 RNA polymerase factor sigma-54 [Verticiella sediminum]